MREVNPTLLAIFEHSLLPERFSFLSMETVESWNLGNSDFTIDFWIHTSTGGEHHIAVTKAVTGEQKQFIDGVGFQLACDPIELVRNTVQSNLVDEFRVSKGIVRYKSDFTPER